MSLQEIRRWLSDLRDVGAMIPAGVVLDRLPESEEPEPAQEPEPEPDLTWREKMWTAPSETRIGVVELVEALGRSRSWVYHRTAASAESRIPHRKLDGELVFVVGEIRAWIRDREEVGASGPRSSTPESRRLEAL